MLLAELEIMHTRAAVPTRRVALGHMILPVDPPPGFGGLLLGGIMARYFPGIDVELRDDVRALIGQIERGERVSQPRLRHRYQVDRHALALSRHQLRRSDVDNAQVVFEFAATGSDLAQVLGAVYALERLDEVARASFGPLLIRATRWTGALGPELVAHLAAGSAVAVDPVRWAQELLGFPDGSDRPSKREVSRKFRQRLHDIHPDRGGSGADAASAILQLNEARRILTK